MNKKSTHALLPGAIAAGIVLAAIQASSDELGIDWGRKEGIDVPTGQSAVQTDAIRVSDGGAFVKAGDGTLTLPLANLDAIGEVPVEIWDGRLEIQPGAPAAATVSAPAFITDKAAFWVDADAAASFVLDGSGDALVRPPRGRHLFADALQRASRRRSVQRGPARPDACLAGRARRRLFRRLQ